MDKSGAEDFMDRGSLDPELFPAAWDGDWRQRYLSFRGLVRFDAVDGWPCRSRALAATVPDEDFVGSLPPALQLAVRARVRLGDDVKVVQKGWGCKVPGVRVALDAQAKCWDAMCELQARLDIQYAFSVDASSGAETNDKGFPVRDEWGWTCKRTAAAVVGHDGSLAGGVLDPEIPSDNYVGELAALIVALRKATADSNVLVIFDATSPLKAWRKFRARCVRGKWKYYAAPMLEELEGHVRRLRLVYFWWQSSHCGAPVNEVADLEAEAIRRDVAAEVLSFSEDSTLFSMRPSRPVGPVFAWAKRAMDAGLRERIGSGVGSTLCAADDDWDLGLWEEEIAVVLSAMRRETLMTGDAGHKDDACGVREEARAQCPLGCTIGASTWMHYVFVCEHGELRVARARWRAWVLQHRTSFDSNALHRQIEATLALIRGRGHSLSRPGGESPVLLARRLLAGLVEKTACGSSADRAREKVRELVQGGSELLLCAVRLERELRLRTARRVLDIRASGRALRAWRARCKGLGPGRAALLFQIRLWRTIAVKVAAIRIGEGSLSADEAASAIRRLWGLLAEVHRVARQEVREVFTEAGVLWFCRWRLFRRLARRKVGDGWTVIPWCPALHEVVDAVCLLWPEARSIRIGWRRRVLFFRSFSRHNGERIRVPLVIPGMWDRQMYALRRWLRAGGVPLLRRTGRRLLAQTAATRREAATREREAAQARIRNFCSGLACSGGQIPAVPAEERFVLDIAPCRKRQRESTAWRAGQVADRRGRWAVDYIIRIRGLEPQEEGWEALVEWKGPFEPSWVKEKDLFGPAKEEARAMADELYLVQKETWPEFEQFFSTPTSSPDPPAAGRRSARLAGMKGADEGLQLQRAGSGSSAEGEPSLRGAVEKGKTGGKEEPLGAARRKSARLMGGEESCGKRARMAC